MRTVSWFSCGAASAIATKLTSPDVIAYCETGSEDIDNKRFMGDCKKWFNRDIEILQSEKYVDTWDVWQKKRYISGNEGAPCTGELKVKVRLAFQREDDLHIFGYTADSRDVKRFESLKENWPELNVQAPLIERGINKKACIAMIQDAGIVEPISYRHGFHNANCRICCKATSPSYYALVRKVYPADFYRMAGLCRELGVRLARVGEERIFIDEIPLDQPTTEPLSPECDFLCQLAEQEYASR